MQLRKDEIKSGNKFYLIITSEYMDPGLVSDWSTHTLVKRGYKYQTLIYTRDVTFDRKNAVYQIMYDIPIDGHYYNLFHKKYGMSEIEMLVHHQKMVEKYQNIEDDISRLVEGFGYYNSNSF